MYEVIVCPIKRLYDYALDGDMSEVAVVATSSYEINQDKLNGFYNTLCIHFDDITDEKNPKAFNLAIADKIADFVKRLPKELDSLFVCCDSGESRSSAFAAAISRYNGLDEISIWKNPHYHPNPLVYRLLSNALGVEVSKEEVENKLKINQKAFSDAIKNS
ncbi:MAG: hypothetical protein IIU65_06295 [Clostridia bacterium]|nr:hypothetical protein [Clostridia bacterium]